MLVLNSEKVSHRLPVKQTSRKKRSPEREKSKTTVRSTLETPVRVQKIPVRKSIPAGRNQEESEDSSDEDYRPEDDGYDSEYESIVDSVINCNINECDFSKINCVETESDLDKPVNAEFSKTIKKK